MNTHSGYPRSARALLKVDLLETRPPSIASGATAAKPRSRVLATGMGAIVFQTCLTLSPVTASAQNATPPAPADQGDALQEVVVTAEHKEQNAQKTAIAMSVYGGDLVKQEAITDVASLSAIAPDVNFSKGNGESIVTIRGISSRDTSENGDPAVTVNVDGFYLNRAYGLSTSLYDIDRIEVLRGPQGTLNGRNAVGGAINIVTAMPTNDFAAYSSIAYGNYNDLNLQGMANLPVNDSVQLRLAFLSVRHDGYRNNSPQPDGDAQDDKSARVTLAFEPVGNFRSFLTLQYTNQTGAGDVVQNIPFSYTSTGALDHALPAGINPDSFHLGTPSGIDLTEKQARLRLIYDFDSFSLTALGGYDQTAWHHRIDESNPYSPITVYSFAQNEYPDTENAELRATSRGTGPFQWQAGLFYFHEGSHLLSADAAPQADGTENQFFGFVYSTRSHSEAAYAQASYNLTDALKLTAGARFTRDYKEEEGWFGIVSTNTQFAYQVGSFSSTKPTYHVSLDYDLSSSNLLYAKVDTGYKTGGFNFGGGTYTPETVTAYEIGSKNRFFDNRLQANLAAFFNDYTNQQVQTTATLPSGQTTNLIENAGASRIWGLESDFIAKVAAVGEFNAAVNYLHARYTDFLSVADPSDPQASGNVQLAGNTPPQAPTWSISFGLNHDWEIQHGTLSGRIESRYQSSSNFSFYNFPDTRQSGYTMSNAFLSYAPQDSRWKVTAFVKNFTDAAVFSTAQENQYGNSYSYQFYPPRTYGMRVETSW